MPPDDAKAIFLDAIEHHAPDNWHAFVSSRCGYDEQLRNRVLLLLKSHTDPASLVAESALNQTGQSDEIATETSTTIGPYQIREQIGEGGMGVVYVAEQSEPVQRKVALKIVKPGMDTKEVIARFEAERQALAFMEHPNIARVLDAGATESGRSYFVMELVRGIPITEYCDQVKATPRERLELFQTVCDAVQHAHQKGIIHRDIKPSNVLVTQVSAKPVVKVIDFGLAKAISGQRLTEKTLYTGFMKLMGTPAYMSPEQAGLSGLDVDTRSDIYSLGVLLYELLTGTTPLDKTEIQKQAYDELCRQIRELDAPKPSTRFSTLKDAERSTVAQLRQIEPSGLRQLLNGDLDRVVLKAIEKDRERRYGSPQDLAADVERFLDDKPVLAVPPSQWYLAQKYLRRHKVAIFTAAAIAFLMIFVSVFSTWQAIRVSKANRRAESRAVEAETANSEANAARRDAIASRDLAEQAVEEGRRLLYAASLQNADQLWNNKAGTPKEVQELLAQWIPTDGKDDLRETAWRFQWTRLHLNAAQTVTGIKQATLSPSGNLIVGDATGIREWDETTNRFLDRWKAKTSEVNTVSPCGRWAAAHRKSTGNDSYRLIELTSGRTRFECPGNRARFSECGKFLLVWILDHQTATPIIREHRLWRTDDGTEIELTPVAREMFELAWSPQIASDGKSFSVIERDSADVQTLFSGDSTPRLWNSPSGAEVVAWSPNQELVVVGRHGGELHFHTADDTDNPIVVNARFGRSPSALAFTNDGTRLAVGSQQGVIDIYDVSQLSDHSTETDPRAMRAEVRQSVRLPTLVSSFHAHIGEVRSVIFSNDGRKLVSLDSNSDDSLGTGKLWDLVDADAPNHTIDPRVYPLGSSVGLELENTPDGVGVSHVQPSQHDLVSGEIQRGDTIVGVSDSTGHHAISESMDLHDVRRLLCGPFNSTVEVQVKRDGLQESRVVKLVRLREDIPTGSDLKFASDGASIFVASPQGVARVSMSGKANWSYRARSSSPSLSPTGELLAFDDSRKLILWNLQSDSLHATFDASVIGERRSDGRDRATTTFSPDGKFVAVGTSHRLHSQKRPSALRVWNVSTGEEIGAPLLQNDWPISGLQFTPNSEMLIATDSYGVMRSWDTATWEQTKTVQGLLNSLSLEIAPDGKTLVQGGYNGFIVWNLPEMTKRRSYRDQSVSDFKFSRDGRTLVTVGFDGVAVMWDPERGRKLATLVIDKGDFSACDFSPNGDKLAILSFSGPLWLREILPLEEIDRHPLTTSALYQRGVALNEDEQFELAEQTLAYALRMQVDSLPSNHTDLTRTRRAYVLALDAQGKLPTITKHVETQRVVLGQPATMNVEVRQAKGLEDCDYQWYFGDAPIEGANQRTLTIENVRADQLGRYRVEARWGQPELGFKIESAAFVVDAEKPIAKGGLRREIYRKIEGTSVTDLTSSPKFPGTPDDAGSIGDLELPTHVVDNFGVRLSGFIIPPTSGEYVFYICSDDSSQLFLSTDESSENKRPIAELNGWNTVKRGWEALVPGNVSQPIALEAGKRYWIEAHYKEAKGSEHFAVTWQLPGEPPPKEGDPPIPARFLEHRLE